MPRIHYRIRRDRHRITTWTPLDKGTGGGFVLDGVEYAVEVPMPATHALLTLVGGPHVAVAAGLGRTPWTVRADGAVHTFVRSLERWSEQVLVLDGEEVGGVRRVGRHLEADLPGMTDPVAVFTLAVVITLGGAHGRGRPGVR